MAKEYWWKKYSKDNYGIQMAEGPYEKFGKNWPRITGGLRVTGKAQFTTDTRMPRLLHCFILRSPYAHARVKSIDTSEAEAMPGVVAVLTYKDSAPLGQPIMISSDRPLFPAPDDEVGMEGQEIAAVIAENPNQAADALEKIKVEYDVLSHVLTIEEAIAPGAPQSITGRDNVIPPRVYNRGDIEAGFEEADEIVEERYWPQKLNCQGLEPRQSVAWFEGGTPPHGTLTIWCRSQWVWGTRDGIAAMFGWPQHKVRCVSKYHGGSYGSSALSNTPVVPISVLGALKTGKPVRCSNSIGREGENTAGGHGHAWERIDMKVGVKNDGTLTAIQCISYNDSGAFGSGGITTYIFDLYVCPNLRIENYRVYTNHSNTGTYRAVDDPHTHAALESTMDKVAYELGMDPIEFRKKNFVTIEHGDQPPLPTPREMSTCNIVAVVDQMKEAIGWDANWHQPGTKTLPDGRLHGIALVPNNDCHGTTGTIGDTLVKMDPDGTAQMLIGAVDNGNGLWTMCAVIGAEELGIDPGDITVVGADTFTTHEAGGSWGSTRTVGSGWGATTAWLDLKRQLADAAIARFWPDATLDDLEFKDHKVTNKKTGEYKSISDVSREASSYYGGAVIGRGYRPPDIPEYEEKYRRMNWAAHACEIAVDPETGEIEVLKYALSHDVGPPINYLTFRNQADGGAIQGISGALFERHFYDTETGVCLNDNYEDFKLATIMDDFTTRPTLQSRSAVTLVNGIPDLPVDRMNHHGVRGFAEPPKTPNSAVLANAFYNATGKRPTVWPLTPDKVIPLLRGEEVPKP